MTNKKARTIIILCVVTASILAALLGGLANTGQSVKRSEGSTTISEVYTENSEFSEGNKCTTQNA